MIVVENLTRRFGSVVAVDGVSFRAEPGRVTGLLGPNGAGKTTTLSMISGLLKPDSGRVLLQGIDVAERPLEAKALLGVVPQEIELYEEISARENLEFWGALRGLDGKALQGRIDEVLNTVELAGRNDPVAKFSGGMKRRLNLAAGILHHPPVLLLDEPTVGIDVHARARILEIVREEAKRGTTVLYTTHYLEEAEGLCDRIAIMDHGKILADDETQQLKRSLGEGRLVIVRGNFEEAAFRERVRHNGTIHFPERGRAILGIGENSVPQVLEHLFASGLAIDDVTVQEPRLENVFLKLTGRELRD
jgi:ABC-2 type transport system ATP-binding protein